MKSELKGLLTFSLQFFLYASFSLLPDIICSIHKWNVFMKDKIWYGYICYIKCKYFAYFIAVFVGKYNFSISENLLAWWLFKGFRKATNCPFTCRINLRIWLKLTFGKTSLWLHMGRNTSQIPQRRRCFPRERRNGFLMVCSQGVLWSNASVTVFFWRVNKDDKLLLLLNSTNQMWWTKWFLCLLFWHNCQHLRNTALQLLPPFFFLFHTVWELSWS